MLVFATAVIRFFGPERTSWKIGDSLGSWGTNTGTTSKPRIAVRMAYGSV